MERKILTLDPGKRTGVCLLQRPAGRKGEAILEAHASSSPAVQIARRYIEPLSIRESKHFSLVLEGWEDQGFRRKGGGKVRRDLSREGGEVSRDVMEIVNLASSYRIQTYLFAASIWKPAFTKHDLELWARVHRLKLAGAEGHTTDAIRLALYAMNVLAMYEATRIKNWREQWKNKAKKRPN